MCGLVGWLAADGEAHHHADALQRAAAALIHRGPDDDGFFYDRDVGLAFRRLAILDLTATGHQPMTSADGRWTLVFNGEIYNFIEIRRELERAGVRFQGSSDTEVLVEGLAYWGWAVLERCNGMWAILAWHRETRTLYAVRDPWNIKPLYVHRGAKGVCLASEIGALRAFGCELGDLDLGIATHFIATGELDTTTRTPWTRIARLQGGRIYAFRGNRELASQTYDCRPDDADLPRPPDNEQGDAAYIEAFTAALRESVHLRLRADVPVGTCMSGGLDSTGITCLAAERLKLERATACRHAFTAQFAQFDERSYIDAVLAQTGAIWHTTVCDDDHLQQQVHRFFGFHGEPVHSLSALAGFLVVSLAARAEVKVLLNGQGADELLAGYASTVGPYLRAIVRASGPAAALSASRAEHRTIFQAGHAVARAYAGMAAGGLPDTWHATLSNWRSDAQKPDGLRVAPDGSLGPNARAATDLQQNLRDQQFRSPLPLFLRVEDINASAFSLESRLPFLDPTLVALARRAPPTLLRRHGRNKYLLRQALRGVIPEIVRTRPDKMGFPVPSASWWRGPLAPLVRSVMTRSRLEARGIYDTDRVLAALETLLAGGPLVPWLDRVLLFELWAARHVDNAPYG